MRVIDMRYLVMPGECLHLCAMRSDISDELDNGSCANSADHAQIFRERQSQAELYPLRDHNGA